MDNHFIHSLPLWLCCICFSFVDTCAINCTSSEREALIAFKQSLSDPSARLSSWTGENCCEWSGITCDLISKKVAKIDLRNSLGFTTLLVSSHGERQNLEAILQKYKNSCLGGEISSSLLELKYLNYLDLSLNNFDGVSIPHFLGMFESLRYLNLSSANFGGEIPHHLGNLSNLKYLDLSVKSQFIYEEGLMANLKVENLHWLSSLSSLGYLDVGGVDLSGLQANWMYAVNSLPSLSELHLSGCNIPSFDSLVRFENLTSLKVLDLSCNSINSSLPLWLSNLTSLTKLDLSINHFQGTILWDFVKLKNLKFLDLSGNNLRNNDGNHMPICLRNLCELQFLNLKASRLIGTIGELLGSFSNCSHSSLKFLDLSLNELVGEVPNLLGTLKNLQYISLSENNLWGSLPNSVGNLSLLQDLSISLNLLNGTIPPNFGQLSELISFNGNENPWKTFITEAHLVNLTKLEILEIFMSYTNQDLVFNVSYDWIPPFRLKTLQLRNCLVGPQFPVWLQVQTQLTGDVIISNAGIAGSIPSMWISNISSQITSLDLSNNLLEGNLSHLLPSKGLNPIDSSHNNLCFEYSVLERYPKLTFLYLQYNLLSGSIPSNIGNLMPNLIALYLAKNRLNGTIPLSFQRMRHLRVLLLSDNQLSGELFDYWDKFKSLTIIDLENNNLHGRIPSSIGMLTSLKKLILSNNHFHGEIPKSLRNCSDLKSIDLSGNRLHGSLPSWIGELVSQLWLINLRSNHFNGTIPRQWCNLPMLRVFDLSNNNLSGEIPSCLYNWTTLVNYKNIQLDDTDFNNVGHYSPKEKTTLVMKGREFEYDKILYYVLAINLSRNKLRGEIPNEITNLLSLGALNLSNNDLVGAIPENIGAMQQLESLDLSCNHLSGNIPTSLASLNFLTNLNMSFNNLAGRIPTGRQLQTLNDPSIYEGNPLLTKSSSGENTDNNGVPISTSEEDGKENDSEMFGFCISMTIGFPIGLNILFFTIFTSQSRRMSYFSFIDHVSYNVLENIGFAVIWMRRMRRPRA